ncbi:hypothetical protein B0J13DRAFT_634865 [Dactylonectria estremocensis]|uniref:Zn(2)-C6 fungal-type domain-containing protein n=1 Tax=Dactylonectria estremocensis TaxID=1079267 RepID=A0A9P9FM18_9HYPO|nr:hypothetical protein B0J13DRAFT_634865 [Dactylonectria estremocensis]
MTVAAFQSSGGIIVPGISLGAVMRHDEPRAQQTPTLPQTWNDQPQSRYFLTDLSVESSFPSAAPANVVLATITPSLAQQSVPVSRSPPPKAKRVRTGCLTCRDRHLKCDETVPDCLNCRKRGRECKRGVRLNFLDINVHSLACEPVAEDWAVQFHDESRDIASEYQGGLSRYAPYDSEPEVSEKVKTNLFHVKEGNSKLEIQPMAQNVYVKPLLDTSDNTKATSSFGECVPKSPPPVDCWPVELTPTNLDDHCSHSRTTSDASNIATPSSSSQSNNPFRATSVQRLVTVSRKSLPHQRGDLLTAASILPHPTAAATNEIKFPITISADDPIQPLPNNSRTVSHREFLSAPEEIAYMQVFVEDVWVWMDSLDKEKHFSRLIPFYALKSTMLLNAFLACGVKRLALSSPEENGKALFYYNTATSQLLRSLQNPDRNMAECATTAVILNVYEIMSEKPTHRMRHIGGARALILECGWDARSTGIGAACFWQNITMELLICVSENWQTKWNPDDWGLDLDFFGEGEDQLVMEPDEVFVHRILFVITKIVNFRAAATHFDETATQDSQTWHRERLSQWQELKRLCDRWNIRSPRTMRPYGYMKPSKPRGDSAFPCIWMIKRAATLGRLFYHTAQYILTLSHPAEQTRLSEGMREMQLHHAHHVCGIVACTKDRGVALIAVRCLVIVSAALTELHEQGEILEILERIKARGGWCLGSVDLELKRAWGWDRGGFPEPGSKNDQPAVGKHSIPQTMQSSVVMPMANSVPPLTLVTRVLTPPGVANPSVNPLSFADFSLPNHPYQNWYEPPNKVESRHPNE